MSINAYARTYLDIRRDEMKRLYYSSMIDVVIHRRLVSLSRIRKSMSLSQAMALGRKAEQKRALSGHAMYRNAYE